MIKHLLTVVAFLPMAVMAQNNLGKIGFTEVVDVAGATASTLSTRANTFLNSKKIETKTVGNTISGIGTFTVAYPSVKKATENGYVKFDAKIMVKDGKYKVDLTNFRHEGMQGRSTGGSLDLDKPECGEAQLTATAWVKIKEQNQSLLDSFVQELKTKMNNPVKTAAPSSDF